MAQFTPASFNERVVACAIALAGFLIYAGTLGHQYTLDDLQVVQQAGHSAAEPAITEALTAAVKAAKAW